MLILIALVMSLVTSASAYGQVTCSQYGQTLYCDGRKPISITEFSPSMGIIQTDESTTPYTILGSRDRGGYTPYDSTPLKELDPLPSYSYRGSTSDYSGSSYGTREPLPFERLMPHDRGPMNGPWWEPGY